MVEGLQSAFSDDDELLARGIALFDVLHRGLQAEQPATSRVRHLRLPKTGGLP